MIGKNLNDAGNAQDNQALAGQAERCLMRDVEKIISDIVNADEVEIMEFDFTECFTALREMRNALMICKETFDFYRTVRGCDGALEDAVEAVNKALFA